MILCDVLVSACRRSRGGSHSENDIVKGIHHGPENARGCSVSNFVYACLGQSNQQRNDPVTPRIRKVLRKVVQTFAEALILLLSMSKTRPTDVRLCPRARSSFSSINGSVGGAA
jgi:hypothetical protein